MGGQPVKKILVSTWGLYTICINLTETSLYSGFGRNLLNAAIFFIH